MQYIGLAVLVACLALLLLYLTLRLGWRLEWLLGWLKGCVLLILLAMCTVIGLLAWELSRFTPITDGARAATLEFGHNGPQQHQARVTSNGVTQQLLVHGELWELDVQVLRWAGLPSLLGLEDGYRLNNLSGRYLTLEQQREMGASLAGPLHSTPPWRDAWRVLDKLNLSWLYTDAFVIRFMPIADGARYAVEIGATGLSPVALNPQALEAMKGFD